MQDPLTESHATEGQRAEVWWPARFKGARVFVLTDPSGHPKTDPRGLVPMVYRKGGKVYSASERNIRLLPRDSGDTPRNSPRRAQQDDGPLTFGGRDLDALLAWRGPAPPVSPPPPDARVEIWTDGACSGNPGPTGAAAMVKDWRGVTETARFLGKGTNNIGELVAVLLGLSRVASPDVPVVLFSDSEYVIGVLTKGWKARKNSRLIREIRERMARLPEIELKKVPGHAGIPENDRVDRLARRAAHTGKDRDVFSPTPPP